MSPAPIRSKHLPYEIRPEADRSAYYETHCAFLNPCAMRFEERKYFHGGGNLLFSEQPPLDQVLKIGELTTGVATAVADFPMAGQGLAIGLGF